MNKGYCVYFQNKLIGESQICRNGLYYQVFCRCDQPGNDIYRLVGIGEKGELDLGVCIPEKGKLVVNKNVPVNRFPVGMEHFELKANNTTETDKFIAVKQDEPFLYISKLVSARLCSFGEKIGVILDD